MQDLEKKIDDTTTMMALAALMFFSPFVLHMMRSHVPPLSDKDKAFVGGYCTLGYITLFLLVLSSGLGIASYLYVSPALTIGYAVSIGILLLLLLVGSLCIIANVPLHLDSSAPVFFAPLQEKKSAILYFLPLYNIWARYHLHSFQSPNRWLKESLLRWTFFLVLCVSNHPLLISVLVIIITLRAATLFVGIDVLSLKVKDQVNALFNKNPEELRGYVTGTCVYLARSLGHLFHPSAEKPTIQYAIDQEKELYSRLYPLRGYPLLWSEYLIACGGIFALLFWIAPDKTLLGWYVPLFFLGGRYLIMIFGWQHLPRLPIAREILLFLRLPFFLFSRGDHAETK